MSAWQDYGFPNNLRFAEPATVLTGLIGAINERRFPAGGLAVPSRLAAISQTFCQTIEDEVETLYTDWYLRTDSTTTFCVDDADLLAKINNPSSTPHADLRMDETYLESMVLGEPLLRLEKLGPLFSVEWALQKYKILNHCRIHRTFCNSSGFGFDATNQPNPSFLVADDNSVSYPTVSGGQKNRAILEIQPSTSNAAFINANFSVLPNYYGKTVASHFHAVAVNPFIYPYSAPYSDFILDADYEDSSAIYHYEDFELGMSLGSFELIEDGFQLDAGRQVFFSRVPTFPTLPLREIKQTWRGLSIGAAALTFDLTDSLTFYDEEA